MSAPWLRLTLWPALAVLGTAVGSLQIAGPGAVEGEADPTPPGNEPRTFRLTPASSFQEGCFAPCNCPILMPIGLRGTFILVPAGTEGDFLLFDVMDAAWIAFLNDPSEPYRRLAGSGTYRLDPETGLQQMVLNLSADGGTPQRFDSGLVTGGRRFPALALELSVNGKYCFDTVLQVRARPLRQGTIFLDRRGDYLLWEALPEVAVYDVVRGRLGGLRSGDGWAAATDACVANDLPAASVAAGGDEDLAAGEVAWFLVRGAEASSNATWESGGPGQATPRDPLIDGAPLACP